MLDDVPASTDVNSASIFSKVVNILLLFMPYEVKSSATTVGTVENDSTYVVVNVFVNIVVASVSTVTSEECTVLALVRRSDATVT